MQVEVRVFQRGNVSCTPKVTKSNTHPIPNCEFVQYFKFIQPPNFFGFAVKMTIGFFLLKFLTFSDENEKFYFPCILIFSFRYEEFEDLHFAIFKLTCLHFGLTHK